MRRLGGHWHEVRAQGTKEDGGRMGGPWAWPAQNEMVGIGRFWERSPKRFLGRLQFFICVCGALKLPCGYLQQAAGGED